MPSPFPGMDPYLESPTHWSDFHARFVSALADAINDTVPGNYVARIDEHITIVDPYLEPPGGPTFVPDVAVTRGRPEASTGGAFTAVASPPAATLTNLEHLDPHTETYLRIVRLPDLELVTVLELLSPTNKYGDGRGEYMRKRHEFLRQPVNVVELDLLRAGPRIRFAQPLPPGHYYAFVSRSSRPGVTDAYPWTVRSRLPIIPIPLRQPDADVALSLAEPFSAAYERGRYARLVKYTTPPPPPGFAPEDAEWVAETARAATRPT